MGDGEPIPVYLEVGGFAVGGVWPSVGGPPSCAGYLTNLTGLRYHECHQEEEYCLLGGKQQDFEGCGDNCALGEGGG